MVVGSQAAGPDITVDEAIRIRAAVGRSARLDLTRLPVTNESLAIIPNDVMELALIDTPISDEGISSLLRLQSLSRVNLAGTRVTDDGLQDLGKLPNLEWVCVNRTQVTAAGVERLKGIRSDVAVLIGRDR